MATTTMATTKNTNGTSKARTSKRHSTKRARPKPVADGGLADFDIELIGWVHLACTNHGCGDFIDEIFTMPPTARRRLADIICKVNGTHVVGGVEDMDPAERHRCIAELHDEVSRNGGQPSLADAFVLPRAEWQAKYVRRPQAERADLEVRVACR